LCILFIFFLSKMMRKVLLCTGLAVAAADKGVCALDGARAVDDLLDSATYIWASVERCKKPSPTNKGNQILCAMDVSSVLESVNAMINVVLKGVDKCGDLEGENKECGLAAGVLTKTFAGVAAASAGVTAKCPNKLNGGKALTFLNDGPGINQGNGALAGAAQSASFAECLVDVSDITKSLFKATNRVIHIRNGCPAGDEDGCAHNSLKVIAAFSAMGQYMAGAVGRCSAQTAKNAKLLGDAQCAAESLELVRHLTRMGSAGADMNKACFAGEQRLYELEHGAGDDKKKGDYSLSLILGACLPIAAVFGFVGGSRFAKNNGASVVRDSEFE